MTQTALSTLTLVCSVVAFGCAQDPSERGAAEPTPPYQAIVGDAYHTDEASEIQQLALSDGSWCTATLIGDHTILTAAHCFNYGSRSETTASGHLFTRGARSANVLRYQSLGNKPGIDDIAVAEIDGEDLSWYVSPDDIWPFDPPKEWGGALYGFGCDNPNWNTVSHDWDCRGGNEGFMHIAPVDRWSLNVTSPNGDMAPIIAHGDSGGPMFVSGKIVGVISEMSTTYYKSDGSLVSTHAVLASVVRNHSFIEQWRNTFN